MDHLYIPESCRPQIRAVPYCGLAPKYDCLGFDGLPERHSLDSKALITSHSLLQWRADWMESFLQEWLWFGLMHEFANKCSIELNLDDLITLDPCGNGQVITTALLLHDYARRIIMKQIDCYATILGLEVEKILEMPYDPAKEPVAQILDLLYSKFQPSTDSTEISLSEPSIEGPGVSQPKNCGDGATSEQLRDRLAACQWTWKYIQNNGEKPSISRKPSGPREKLAKCISDVQRITRVIMSQKDPIVRFEILLSIEILCHSLAKIVDEIFDESIMIQTSADLYPVHFERSMVDRNWCRSRVGELTATASLPAAYVASLLPSYQADSHRECRPRKCLRRPLTLSTMGTQHRPNCSGHCMPTSVSESKLIEVLKLNGIPGLRLVSDKGQIGYRMVN